MNVAVSVQSQQLHVLKALSSVKSVAQLSGQPIARELVPVEAEYSEVQQNQPLITDTPLQPIDLYDI